MDVRHEIRVLATKYAAALQAKVESRIQEMKEDNTSHYLIYRVFGITDKEGELIDVYQNKGRFLYKYAGSFLEDVAKLCFLSRFPESASLRIPNTEGKRPKTFEIDCVIDNDAVEIKWRDATTDGDHIMKEHTRLRTVEAAGYHPIRIMFYYPNRAQAIKIQQTLQDLYKGLGGEYYYGDSAWEYVQKRSGVDLLGILKDIADEQTSNTN